MCNRVIASLCMFSLTPLLFHTKKRYSLFLFYMRVYFVRCALCWRKWLCVSCMSFLCISPEGSRCRPTPRALFLWRALRPFTHTVRQPFFHLYVLVCAAVFFVPVFSCRFCRATKPCFVTSLASIHTLSTPYLLAKRGGAGMKMVVLYRGTMPKHAQGCSARINRDSMVHGP